MTCSVADVATSSWRQKFARSSSPQGGLLATGNSRLAMVASVEASLKRLKTDRLDLYWVHYADGVTRSRKSFAVSTTSCAPARSFMPAFQTSPPGAWRAPP